MLFIRSVNLCLHLGISILLQFAASFVIFEDHLLVGCFFPTDISLQLVAYSDVDWAGCPNTRRSTTGWCMFLGDALISWRCKKQDRVSKSSTEAEYRAMSTSCSEIVWLRGLLEELGFPQTTSTPLHADNTSAIQIATNPVFHEHTKHIEVDCHSIRDTLESRVISLLISKWLMSSPKL